MRRTFRLLNTLLAALPLLFAVESLGQGSTCATAVVIAPALGIVADGPNAGGGNSTVCAGGGVNADWYIWTPATGGIINNISACSGPDTRLSIFNGTGGCGGLTCVGFNDDSGCGNFGYGSALNNVAVNAGTPYYIEWDDRWEGTGFTWDFTFTGFSCTQPAGTAVAAQDCANNQYFINVNITSLGNATSVDLVPSVGAPINGIIATGPQVLGPFASGTTVSVTLEHNDDATCNVALGAFIIRCALPGTCVSHGIPDAQCPTQTDITIPVTAAPGTALGTDVTLLSVDLIVTHTWNSDNTYQLVSTNGTTITLIQNRFGSGDNLGGPVCPGNFIRLVDGGAPLSFTTMNDVTGDWAPEQPMANLNNGANPNGTWTLRVCDGAGGDISNVRYVQLNFVTCLPPAATVTLIEQCGTNSYDLSVNVTSLGTSPSIDIIVTPGADILGVNATGIQSITGIPGGTITNISITASDPACNTNEGNFIDCCNGTCAAPAPAVVGVNVASIMNCGAGASNLGSGGAIDARWYSFTPPSTGQISIDNCGTNDYAGLTLHDATPGCGSLGAPIAFNQFGACGTGAQLTGIPVTGGTTYLIEWDDRWNGGPFNWNLSYVSCTPPSATGSATDNCGAGTFTIAVNVTSLGSSTQLQVESDVNGVEVASVTATGVVNIPATYTAGTPVTITLRSTSDANCFVVVGTFTDCCSGVCTGAAPASLGTNTNGDMNCGAGASNASNNGIPPTNARWWTWTPASSGLAVASACTPPNNTNFDTFVTVHTGSCGSLTLVGADDDACNTPGFGSTFGWLANAGTQYTIEWDDRWSGTGHDWDLSLTPCVAPARDECTLETPASRQLFVGGTFNFNGDATCANDDVGIANIFGGVTGYVWATFQLMECADVVIDYCGTADFTNGALNMYTDCSGVGPVNSQTFNFITCGDGNPSIFYNSLPAGIYYYPVLWGLSFPSGTYNLNISANTPDIACTPNVCTDALPVTCGGTVSGTTVSNTNTQGPSVCLPNHVGPGPNAWYYVDALTSEVYTASTCVGTNYNSMITVYDAGVSPGSCATLTCLTGNDDNCGAGTNTPSEANWAATSGNRYYIVVHGPGGFVNSTGIFTLSLTCSTPTCAAPANDLCGGAPTLVPVLGDGSGLPSTGTNCGAFADANPSCDVDLSFVPAAGRAQGVWYTFNSGTNDYMSLTLLDQDLDVTYSATALSYALYSGSCGALTEVACVQAGEGTTAFPLLTQGTNYWVLVHNQGNIGTEGTFGILLEFPAQNDAEVTSIDAPAGNLCTTTVSPVVTITNNGQQPLASVTVTYDVDGGTPVVGVINFAPALTYGQSQQVALASSITTGGPHTLNVATSLPNGVADELPGDDSNSGAFTVDGEAVNIIMVEDQWGGETTWEIYDALEIAPIATGGPYSGPSGNVNTHTLCLPLTFGNCFTLRIQDSFGDGMCCLYGIGTWEVRSPSGAVLIRDVFHGSGTLTGSTPNGGTDSPNASNPTYTGHEFCLPKGPADIEAGECGIYNNVMNNKVYAVQAPGTGPYQFEFSDPDNGFRRRISVQQRFVKFSQMQTNPLIAGTHYFGRARRDAGNDGYFNDNWGSGCEMGLDATALPGCGQLINDVGSPTHSCGVTKSFGYSDKVWAQPVLGATQYRFKFEGLIDPDGASGPMAPVGGARIITQASYVRVLNWFTYTLVDGQTYTVTVEVFVSGTWSGFCGPACSVTIDNPPAFGGRVVDTVADTDVQLYPNPVRDGNVNLVLNGLSGLENTVSVDIYDMFGKRVFTSVIGTEGATQVSTTLELGTSMASGVYMVDVTMGDRQSVQRLTIQ